MCAVITTAQTDIRCGRRMAGLKELRETILSCTLKHSADLNQRTQCRETMKEEEEEEAMCLHTGHQRTQQTAVVPHRCTSWRGTRAAQALTMKTHTNAIDDSKISSQTQLANICSLNSTQHPSQHLPKVVDGEGEYRRVYI